MTDLIEEEAHQVGAKIRRLLPWIVAVAFFMEALDTTILNTAVPSMAEALKAAPLSMKSVLSSYTLSLAVFIPISSWVADRFGSRKVFLAAIGTFTLGSMLCGFSQSLHQMVLCRILQGCGGALMVPVGRLTLVRTIEKSELVRAMSFVAIPTLVGPMLGPVVGGFLVVAFNWRCIFFVNLPIGLLGILLVHRFLPNYQGDSSKRLDLLGLILFGSGIALFSYVLEVFGETGLQLSTVLGLLGLSVILLFAYWLHANREKEPLLDLQLFKIRSFGISTWGNLLTRIGAGGLPFLLPLLYQVGMGYQPLQAGWLMVPQSLAAISFKMTMPPLLRRFGYRRVLLSNTLAIGGSIALYSLIGPGSSVLLIVTISAIFGYCSSLQFTSMNTLVYADIKEESTGMASTILSSVQQLAISFGVAGASLLTALFIPDRFHASPGELLRGLHLAFLILGALTVLSALLFRQLKPGDGDAMSMHVSSSLH